MDPKALRQKRADLLRQAQEIEARQFATEGDGTSFDAAMRQISLIDAQLRAAGEPLVEPVPAAPPAGRPQPTPPADEAARAAGAEAERQRITAIQAAVRAAGLDEAFAAPHVTQGAAPDVVRAAILEELARRQEATETRSPVRNITMGEDARDKYMRGAGAWLIQRSGQAAIVTKHEQLQPKDLDPGEFRGLTLLDMVRMDLERRRIDVRGRNGMEVAGMFFRSVYQTTSDFANLLENTMHRVLRAAYGITPDTWSRVCGVASVSDFRTNNWYRLGSLSVLEELTEHGEFKNKSVPDAEKATYSVGTRGNIVALTRQTIVNDDLGGLMRLTNQLGRAAKLTIEKAFYTQLGLNSGLGPTQADAQPLFHANRSNVGTGAALAAAALDADRVVMAQQLDPNGQDYTDLRPAILLLPVGLGGQARIINESQYDPDTVANKSQMKPNIVAGLFRDIVDTPRLSGTRRYLFADPTIAPVFLVSFLEGQQEPVLETQDGWRTDGVEMKARLDFGVDDVDYRGAVTNAGG